MKQEDVYTTMQQGFEAALDIVAKKGKFYHHHEDRFALLKATAAATGLTPERSTHTLVSKHFTTLPDMLDNEEDFTMEEFDQYFLDILVYISFLRCMVLEKKTVKLPKPVAQPQKVKK